MIAHKAGESAMAPTAMRVVNATTFVGDVTGLLSSLALSLTIARHPFDLL